MDYHIFIILFILSSELQKSKRTAGTFIPLFHLHEDDRGGSEGGS